MRRLFCVGLSDARFMGRILPESMRVEIVPMTALPLDLAAAIEAPCYLCL